MVDFQTPKSDSILPSITKHSILKIAADLGLDPIETKIPIDNIDQFAEAGAIGTLAVISPVVHLLTKIKNIVSVIKRSWSNHKNYMIL